MATRPSSPNLQAMLQDALVRLHKLETGNGTGYASIPDGGSLVVLDGSGSAVLRIGTLSDGVSHGIEQSDGSIWTPVGFSAVGSISMYAAATSPPGYLLCNGAAVSRTTYASLFAAIGATYGAGNGSTTFNIPNLKGRVPAGLDAAQAEFTALGDTGGAKTHTLTQSQIPSHDHGFSTNSAGSHDGHWDPGGTVASGALDLPTQTNPNHFAGSHSHSGTTDAAGSGGSHNNLQPYLVLNYIIKT